MAFDGVVVGVGQIDVCAFVRLSIICAVQQLAIWSGLVWFALCAAFVPQRNHFVINNVFRKNLCICKTRTRTRRRRTTTTTTTTTTTKRTCVLPNCALAFLRAVETLTNPPTGVRPMVVFAGLTISTESARKLLATSPHGWYILVPAGKLGSPVDRKGECPQSEKYRRYPL